MSTRLLEWVQKASFTTAEIQSQGGELTPEQAKTFLYDAITPTVILSRADVFDSDSRKFEVPKFSFSSRIMYGGNAAKRDLEGARVQDSSMAAPTTGLVTLSTELFKGEVPVSDELFEDNVEREGLADSLMSQIALAVGRDLEQIAIMSNSADADLTFGLIDGIIWNAKNNGGNHHDATSDTTYRATLKGMVATLPARFRQLWDQLVFYVPIAFADGYAEEVGQRGTGGGDDAQTQRNLKPYRGIPIIEVPLFSGTQNGVDYSKFALLCHTQNLKVGFHRRVRVEKWRDPREGMTSFLPTVRMDVKWAQPEAMVYSDNLPTLS